MYIAAVRENGRNRVLGMNQNSLALAIKMADREFKKTRNEVGVFTFDRGEKILHNIYSRYDKDRIKGELRLTKRVLV